MTNYITFFAALILTGILYSIYYSNYVFVPKMKKLKMVQEFRYVSNLNSDLIHALKNYVADYNAANHIFMHGLTYSAMISSLENLRDKSYTNTTLKALKAKETSKSQLCELMLDIRNQIEIHNELKDGFSKSMRNAPKQFSFVAA